MQRNTCRVYLFITMGSLNYDRHQFIGMNDDGPKNITTSINNNHCEIILD